MPDSLFEFKKSKNKDLNVSTYNTYAVWKKYWFQENKFNELLAKQLLLLAEQNLKKYDSDFLETMLFLLENSDSIEDLSQKIDKSFPETVDYINRLVQQLNRLTGKTIVYK